MTLEAAIVSALRRSLTRETNGDIAVERPENQAHGDYATNVALKLAPAMRKKPMDIAEELVAKLRADQQMSRLVNKIEIAPPGFINFFLNPQWLQKQVSEIAAAGDTYGRQKKRAMNKVQVEFISANPTGPLTLANGRGGFLGDCLANVLEASGAVVTREYYVNDSGEQVRKLGASVLRAYGYAVPYSDEELYPGGYVKELAQKLDIPEGKGEKTTEKILEHAAREASRIMLEEIKKVVRRAGIRFDTWFSEKSLYRQGFVDEVLKQLKRKKLVEEKDGALWLRLASLPEPRVVVKANGEPTYVLPDLAYHIEKYERRRFKQIIDILGADHHGHAQVLSAGLEALGYAPPTVILLQLVRLVEGGQEVKMSKRSGTFVTLEELLDEVGVDVARWFFLERAPETHMEFDLSLAKERSEKNPVFYVQYAHARCSAILRKAEPAKIRKKESESTQNSYTLYPSPYTLHKSERALMLELVRLPDVLARIVRTHEVHQLPPYATAVATAFSAFYRDCPVLTEEIGLREARLTLVRATQIVLRNTLALMGIRAPEKM